MENKLCTMKTRRNHSEVERELGLLFSKGGKRRNQSKHSGTSTKFQMLVEDIQEGVLVLRGDNSALANDIRKEMKALNGKLLKAKDRNTKRDIRKELKTLSKEERKR